MIKREVGAADTLLRNNTNLDVIVEEQKKLVTVYFITSDNKLGNCIDYYVTGLILGLRPANGRRRYKVTPSLIGWAQT